MTDDPLAYLTIVLDKADAVARAASGGTVVGEPGQWAPSPTGDEWEASRSQDGDAELLVALRTGLPRPPDVLNGLWGVVIANVPDDCDPNAWDPLPQLEHAALHDPAAVLRRIAADRKILAAHPSTENVRDIRGPRFGCRTCHHWDDQIDGRGYCDTITALAEGWGWTGPSETLGS